MNPILKTLADNPLLLEATKQAVLDEFKPIEVSDTDDDVVLGQKTRALVVGMKKVSEAFKKIEKLKTVPQSEERINQAR